MHIPPPLPPLKPSAPERGKILLINPFYPKDPHSSPGKHVLTPTLALTSIAGATPSGWDIAYWDENLLQGPAPADPLPEVVGITVHLTFAPRAYALARRYRALGSKVILGGLHVTSCPKEVEPHGDTIVIGEGTSVWPILLSDLRAGELAKRYQGSYSQSYEDVPLPDRSILPKGAFLTDASIIATRGCRNRCRFCYLSTKGLRMPYRVREPASVAEEIRRSGEKYAVFIDNNLTADKGYAKELAKELRPLGIIWSAAVTIDAAEDEALLSAMAKSGCTGVFVGLETMELANLQKARKRSLPPEAYLAHVKRFHKYGIQVNGSFVFGFDRDTVESLRETVDWIEEAKLECATFHILTPYPGTPLFAELDKAGRILTRDWRRYDTAHVVYRPKGMSPEELLQVYGDAYRRLFALPSIWKRRPQRGILGDAAYLGQSLFYKKADPLWKLLIRRNWTRRAWSPLVRAAAWRQTLLNKDRGKKKGRGIKSLPSAAISFKSGIHLQELVKWIPTRAEEHGQQRDAIGQVYGKENPKRDCCHHHQSA